MKVEFKAIAVIAGVLALGYIAKVTQAGQGIQEFLGGIGKGIGELLSPRIVPEIGLVLCVPWAGLPCTVTSRETGALPGGGSGSTGFTAAALPLIPSGPYAGQPIKVGGTPIPYPQPGWEQYVGWQPVRV